MSFTPKNPLVWCEIPVSDMDAGMAFYGVALNYDLKIDNSGPNPLAFLPVQDHMTGIAGHIYPGKPAGDGSGPTVHLEVPDTLEATAERWKKAGGNVLSDAIPIPAGSFIYATDPDGNSIGLFQFNGAA